MECLQAWLDQIGDTIRLLEVLMRHERTQVLLRTPTSNGDGPGTALVYAASWWNATHVDEYLQVRCRPLREWHPCSTMMSMEFQ